MHSTATPKFHPVGVADYDMIAEAVNQWPEEWRYRFDERAGLLRFASGWPMLVAEREAFKECSELAAAEGQSLAELRLPGRRYDEA